MKKLYRKSTVHPSPSSSSSISFCDQFSLSYLPATILTLATALSADDQEVLAYLLSCSATTSFDFDPSNNNNKSHQRKKSVISHHHTPSFNCYCFSCYTSYWARWDSSPNRQRIHEIIDAVEEDGLLAQRKKKKQGMSRKEKRKNNGNCNSKGLDLSLNLNGNGDNGGNNLLGRVDNELDRVDSVEKCGGEVENGEDETGEKQGSVRKIVGFIGERIWGSVWG